MDATQAVYVTTHQLGEGQKHMIFLIRSLVTVNIFSARLIRERLKMIFA